MEKSLLLKYITFILMGLSSFIGWNSVLSSFHFFEEAYGDRVYIWFVIPFQMTNSFVYI